MDPQRPDEDVVPQIGNFGQVAQVNAGAPRFFGVKNHGGVLDARGKHPGSPHGPLLPSTRQNDKFPEIQTWNTTKRVTSFGLESNGYRVGTESTQSDTTTTLRRKVYSLCSRRGNGCNLAIFLHFWADEAILQRCKFFREKRKKCRVSIHTSLLKFAIWKRKKIYFELYTYN